MKQKFARHQSNKLLIPFIDYLFWVLLILYTNPGGIFQALNIWHVAGRFNINDLLFVFLSICYLIIPKSYDNFDSDFKKIRNYLLIFLIYCFIVFIYLVPHYNSNKDYSLIIALIKSRWTIYSIFLFIYLYEFFKRRWDIFLQVFLFSSVFILILFIQGIISGVIILPVDLVDRGFVKINRSIMFSYGLMPLLVPLGVTAIVFKFRIIYKNLILIGFVLMSIAWLFSITRRHIIGIIIYFILAIMNKTFITGSYKALFNTTLKSALVIVFVTVTAFFIFPKIVEASRLGIVETINIIETGKETGGYEDERLGLSKPFIVLQFIKHPLFGTGFDDRWRGGPEGEKQGYKASDYPFLSALAMFGVIGIMVFIPVYILLLKFLKNDLKYLQNKKNKNNSLLFLLLLTFILYFTFDFLQYWNYFLPVSNSSNGVGYIWYLSLAFYLATRHRFYSAQNQNRILQPNYLLT